jgi:PAS domain S-box-containing protein
VFRTRSDGDRTWGSPQWISFTGLSLEESLGYGWLDAVHPDDQASTKNAWSEAQKTGEYYIEHRVRRQVDGQYLWHQTRAKPIEGHHRSTDDWVGTMTDVDALRGLQDRQRVLMAELQHRTRNLLAVVHSVANQTLRSSTSLDSFKTEFGNRLRALSRVQSLLARVEDESIDLKALVTAELSVQETNLTTGKISIDGPPLALPPNAAQALGLALHELTTNAIKYGALAMSQTNGKLDVIWRPSPAGSEIVLEWRETGVSMPDRPNRKGYGSELIERALPYQLRAKTALEFGSDGVRCVIAVPVDENKQVSHA